ncbi:hypothetical protein ABG768_000447, partial [Culter alburnus]
AACRVSPGQWASPDRGILHHPRGSVLVVDMRHCQLPETLTHLPLCQPLQTRCAGL